MEGFYNAQEIKFYLLQLRQHLERQERALDRLEYICHELNI